MALYANSKSMKKIVTFKKTKNTNWRLSVFCFRTHFCAPCNYFTYISYHLQLNKLLTLLFLTCKQLYYILIFSSAKQYPIFLENENCLQITKNHMLVFLILLYNHFIKIRAVCFANKVNNINSMFVFSSKPYLTDTKFL